MNWPLEPTAIPAGPGTDDRQIRLPATPPPARPVPPAVQAGFEALVARLEGALQGTIGLLVRHLESGDTVGVRADEPFPMASTYKVPIAGTLLGRLDRGELALDDMVAITPRDTDETGPIAQSVRHPGASLSVANLLELMLTQSNNNATDRVLTLAGGPHGVAQWLAAVGARGVRVDRSVNDLVNCFFRFPAGAPSHRTLLERLKTAEEQDAASSTPNAEFDADPRDTATPRAMADLLVGLFAGGLLSARSRELLIDVMTRCETGTGRLRGALPAGTVVAHKTGTIGGTINDVGLIALPAGRGHLIAAVFTKHSTVIPWVRREPVIADLARTAFDYFSLR